MQWEKLGLSQRGSRAIERRQVTILDKVTESLTEMVAFEQRHKRVGEPRRTIQACRRRTAVILQHPKKLVSKGPACKMHRVLGCAAEKRDLRGRVCLQGRGWFEELGCLTQISDRLCPGSYGREDTGTGLVGCGL